MKVSKSLSACRLWNRSWKTSRERKERSFQVRCWRDFGQPHIDSIFSSSSSTHSQESPELIWFSGCKGQWDLLQASAGDVRLWTVEDQSVCLLHAPDQPPSHVWPQYAGRGEPCGTSEGDWWHQVGAEVINPHATLTNRDVCTDGFQMGGFNYASLLPEIKHNWKAVCPDIKWGVTWRMVCVVTRLLNSFGKRCNLFRSTVLRVERDLQRLMQHLQPLHQYPCRKFLTGCCQLHSKLFFSHLQLMVENQCALFVHSCAAHRPCL